MGTTTPTYALPYPVLADPPNVPADMKALAEKIEAVLVARNGLLVPTGAMMPFAGPASPTGWLLCQGQLISRTGYAALFGAIGVAYGAGDGSTTFALPDLRSRVPIGAGQGSGLRARAIGANGGGEDGQVPTHVHAAGVDSPDHAHASSISDGAGTHVHTINTTGAAKRDSGGTNTNTWADSGAFNQTNQAGAHNHSINNPGATARHGHAIAATGVAAGDLNMQPFVVVSYIIKT